MKTVSVLIAGFSQVGVKEAIVFLGEISRIHHQPLGDVERGAWGKRYAQERALVRIVIFRKHPFAVQDNRVVVLHQSFVGETAIRKTEIDGTACQCHAHSQFRSFFRLNIDCVGHIVRKDKQMIRTCSVKRLW